MKQLILFSFAAVLVAISSCDKPAAIFFNDKSTAGKADRAAWTVTASSEELSGEGPVNGRGSALLDGNYNTFWHSQWAGATPPYPHWITIDMKESIKAVTIDITARQNNANGMTKFKLEGSADGSTWTNLKKDNTVFTFDPANKAPQSYAVSSGTALRYLRLTMVEGKVASSHLAEIEVYTVK
jgi:hypothetical protein